MIIIDYNSLENFIVKHLKLILNQLAFKFQETSYFFPLRSFYLLGKRTVLVAFGAYCKELNFFH